MPGLNVAVLEPTELVGAEIVKILEERGFPLKDLILLGGRRSAGEWVTYRGQEIPVTMLGPLSFKGIDMAFFACDKAVSAEHAARAKATGATVIDLSSCFALKDNVPLVIPEVNGGRIKDHCGIIASPRGATVQLALALGPIHRAARIKRVVVSTYQAVSDSGSRALDELSSQIRDLFSFQEPLCETYPHQIAFNALPHVGPFVSGAYTEEEFSIMEETKKVFDDEHLRVFATSVRVPVFYSHAASVNIETARKITVEEVRRILEDSPGIRVEDDPVSSMYPTPIHAAGSDECFVGRIREDLSTDNGIALWIVCDNLRKGSALNAVQIAEQLVSMQA